MAGGMDPSRKRAIRLTVALTVAVLLATALIWTSFSAGRSDYTAGQLLHKGKPGTTYILAGTVIPSGYRRTETGLDFRIRDPQRDVSVPVSYAGSVPDPMAPGRAVLVDVREGSGGTWVGQGNSLTTKCPSKYQAKSS